MAILAPHDEATAILNHYFAQLAQRAGLRWSDRNAADITRATQLLVFDAPEPTDTIPPYAPTPPQLDTRVTVALDRAADNDTDYQRWLKRQQETRTSQRMIQREQG